MAILHKNSPQQQQHPSSSDVSTDDWVKVRRNRAQRRAFAKVAKATQQKKKEQEVETMVTAASPLPQTESTQTNMEDASQQLPEQLSRSSISDASNLISATTTTSEVPLPTPAQAEAEVQPVFTAAEQKMVDIINSVRSKIDQIHFGVPTLQGQINNLSAKLCLLRWGQRLQKPVHVDAEKLIASHKSLYYNAGMIDESTLQQIFRLDSIQTDNNEIRKLRKATVLFGNELIKLSVSLRQRLERIKKALDKLVAKTSTSMQDVSEVEEDESSMKVDESKDQESESSESEVETEEKKQHSKPASPAHAATASPASPSRSSPASPSPAAAATPAPQSKLQKKYGHLNLPTYAGPQFQASVDRSGALVIESDMSGIDSDDLVVLPEGESRTLTVSGVKLPQRTRHIEAHPFGGFFGLPMQQTRVTPHGFFTKRIDLSTLDPHNVLDLSKLSAVVDAEDRLYVTIPRKAAPPQPQQRKVPYAQQYHQHMDEEEDDGADYYSHPFASFSRPQPQRYATYAPYQRNPFFGARGFW